MAGRHEVPIQLGYFVDTYLLLLGKLVGARQVGSYLTLGQLLGFRENTKGMMHACK